MLESSVNFVNGRVFLSVLDGQLAAQVSEVAVFDCDSDRRGGRGCRRRRSRRHDGCFSGSIGG